MSDRAAAPAPSRIGEVTWEIPATARPGMRVPARIIADAEILDHELVDRAEVGLGHAVG